MICCFSLTIFPLETCPISIQIIESQKFRGGAECIIIRSLQYINTMELEVASTSNTNSGVRILLALCRDGCGISALQIFVFNFSKNMFGKNILKKTFFHLFYSNFFSIISEKEVKHFFFKFFFQKCFLKN